jgi:hypothetical protein
MEKIPVVFIHKGYQSYLDYTTRQSSRNNQVHFIGTNNPGNHVTFFDINQYEKYINNFSSVYEHLSTNDYNYELFCFLRWFILKEHMEKNNLDVVFYVDSDVMLYSDITKEYEKFNQFDLTLLHRTAAISSFFTKTGLDNFCDFLINTFTNKSSYNYKKISSHYYTRKDFGLPGGVCDMTYFDFFHYMDDGGGGPGKVGEMMVIIDDSTYDHNVNVSDQYFDFNGIKNIKIKDGYPYVYSHKLKKDIKFNSIHFQGGAKNHISRYYVQ